MGGFVGHAIAGSFFLLFSVWWFIGILIGEPSRERNNDTRRRLLADDTVGRARPAQVKFNKRAWFVCPGRLAKVPLEPILKVVATLSGMIVELFPQKQYALLDENGEFIERHLNDHSHVAMYSFFTFSGVVDLVMWYRVLPLPPGTDYLALSLAFWVEGMLFYFHVDGRPQLDLRMHTILYLIIFITAGVLLLAMVWEKNSLLSILQAYLTSLQGTWFIQIAFALHGPNIWKNTHTNVMVLPIVLAWHMIFWLVFYLVSFAIAHRLCSRRFVALKCHTMEEPEGDEDLALETL